MKFSSQSHLKAFHKHCSSILNKDSLKLDSILLHKFYKDTYKMYNINKINNITTFISTVFSSAKLLTVPLDESCDENIRSVACKFNLKHTSALVIPDRPL